MKLAFSGQIFGKYSNIEFHENPSVGAELFHEERHTDMTKLVLAFRNFAKAPKMKNVCLEGSGSRQP